MAPIIQEIMKKIKSNWIDRLWSSNEYACCACDLSVQLKVLLP